VQRLALGKRKGKQVAQFSEKFLEIALEQFECKKMNKLMLNDYIICVKMFTTFF